MKKTKDVALVLSSGGPRGFAYIGAIEELESRGYSITSVAGCSIGSLVGGIYAAGGLDEFKQWLFRLNNARLMSLLDVSLSKSYLMKGDKVIAAIKEVVPDVLVTMNFDAYGSIGDYARGEEISDLGRKLMSEALDRYER
ncbi:MAG: patatin-like phospholipase family protein [Candidatus Cryptobacteroides sp.]